MHNETMEASVPRIVCLPIARLQSGMRVARAVLRPDGAVLLSSGTEIDEDELAHLHQRGVDTVFVEIPDPRDAQERVAAAAVIEQRVARIFRGASSEARDDLKAAVRAFRLEQNG